MTTIAIVPEPLPDGTSYRAFSGHRQSVGRTPGEALDTLTGQLTEQESGTLIVVQNMRPDEFFTAPQRQRLAELMDRWRQARDAQTSLTIDEQSELDSLVTAELEGSRQRTESLLRQIRQ